MAIKKGVPKESVNSKKKIPKVSIVRKPLLKRQVFVRKKTKVMITSLKKDLKEIPKTSLYKTYKKRKVVDLDNFVDVRYMTKVNELYGITRLKDKNGLLSVQFRFWKGNKYVDIVGLSRKTRLYSDRDLTNALSMSFSSAYKQCPFSPDNIEYISHYFIYYVPKKDYVRYKKLKFEGVKISGEYEVKIKTK